MNSQHQEQNFPFKNFFAPFTTLKVIHLIIFMLFFVITFFLLAFYVINLLPPDSDMFYHIKLGDVIAHQGIIHKDILSQVGSNKLWVPSEWLFEVLLYWFTSLFGFDSFRIFVAIFAVLEIGILYIVLRKILRLNEINALGLSVFFLLLNFDLLTGRPQLIVNTFLIIELFLLFLYVLKNKNFLYILIPLTYLWANTHGSVILSPLVCFSYAVVCLLNAFLQKNEKKNWLKKAKTLGFYTIVISIVSILPLQGIVPYQHLLALLHSRAVDSHFVSEWRPLYLTPGNFLFYSFVISIPLVVFSYIVVKTKKLREFIWFLPLLFFILAGYSALRNTYYGYIALTIIIGWLLTRINFFTFNKTGKIVFCTFAVAIYGFLLWAMYVRVPTSVIIYPENAANFIQKEHLIGNMFNQYEYGGYLEYRLYPMKKALIDGRTLLCCELQDYYSLSTNLSLPYSKYALLLNQFFTRHHISFVLIDIDNQDLLGTKISSVLINDPKWNLVFWDDVSEIFVEGDAENEQVLKKFVAKSATPFENSIYKKGQMDIALYEYEQMTHIQDSAITRNSMGVILATQGKTAQATEQYLKAISLNKNYTNAYFNLAQIKLTQGQYQDAIGLFKQALGLKPKEGLIYIQLARAYTAMNDTNNALETLRQAYNQATNDQQRQVFSQLMQQIQASQ